MKYYPDEVTDDLLNELERRIKKEYSAASKECEKEAAEYFSNFKDRYVKEYAAYKNGDYTQQQFINWTYTQLARGEKWNRFSEELADRMCQANRIAASYINDTTPSVCSLNYLFEAYNIDQNIQAITFNIYDEQTIKRLIANDEIKLPHIEPNYATDFLWNKKKMNSALISNILQGKDIYNLASSFESVTNMNRSAAIRNARTAYTGAQNAGRFASYVQAERHGLKIQKKWIATFDDRTRASHSDLHGSIVDNNDYFANGLRYPGDMEGAPAELYNCRCTMRAIFPNVKGISGGNKQEIDSKDIAQRNFNSNIIKTLFTIWGDYPNNLTKEQKETFDRENPFGAKRLKGKGASKNG